MGIYNIMFIGGLILAILFLILTVVLFFALRIPQALGAVTGKTERKAIEAIRAGKAGEMLKRKRKTQGSIIARDVKSSTSTGTLSTGETDVQKKQNSLNDKNSGKMTGKDTGNKRDTEAIAQEAKAAAAKAAAEMAAKEATIAQQKKADEAKNEKKDKKEKKVHINPKTGKRYELDSEETEVLTYRETHDDPEAPTTFLGAKMPGEDEATDILREGEAVDEQDLYDDDLLNEEESTAILAAGMAMDLDKEETDILTSTSMVTEDGDYEEDNYDASEEETDVLTADGTVASKPAESGEKKKASIGITDMLRKAMEEGKKIPDIEGEDDDDEDEEYTYSESEEITSVLKAEAAAKDALTQDDVHGILDENLTSVLRADMMPGAEEVAPKDDKRIDVMYSKTIVHTEESL